MHKIFEGMDLVKPITDAEDAHEAAAIWWGNAILSGHFDAGWHLNASQEDQKKFEETTFINNLFLRAHKEQVAENIGQFVSYLAFESRERGLEELVCDYEPSLVLHDAAIAAGLPAERANRLFPYKSYTLISANGAVFARLGETGESAQVWPPAETTP